MLSSFSCPIRFHNASTKPKDTRDREAALHSRVALPGQRVALEARLERHVVDEVAAAAALQRHARRLGPDRGRCDHDARDLHQVRDLLRLWRDGEE